MGKIHILDAEHVRLQLGGRNATLDIPKDLQEKYDVNRNEPAPTESLHLEWVYGYRGKDSRNNLLFLEHSSELVYPMAGVVVLMKVDNQGQAISQRHYTEHTDDVMCIALHPDEITIATGQVAGHGKGEAKPHVRIWRADTLETLKVLGIGDFQRAVCCVAFSKSDGGNKLACVDESNDHYLSIWNWSTEKQISEAKSSKEPVLDIEFDPTDEKKLVSCGRGKISFWTLNENNRLEPKRGLFGKTSMPKYITCLAYSPHKFMVSGDSNGSIAVWEGVEIIRTLIGGHDDSVFSVNFLPDKRMVSGGRGRNVVLWDETCATQVARVQLPEFYGALRSVISAGSANGLLFAGTTKNCILSGQLNDDWTPVTEGHRDELWGLCGRAESGKTGFITAGNDGRVIAWVAEDRKSVWAVDIKFGAHCVAMSKKDGVVIVGCQTGHYTLLDATNGKELASGKLSDEQIECVKYSPDENYVALGSRDNHIYLMEAGKDRLKKVGTCSGHSSFILHIDWSKDGTLLRSNSGDYELLYWSMPSCERETDDANTRECEWNTHNCTVSFESIGIWQNANDGTDVNGCAVNGHRTLIASADDFGKINMYRYPCFQNDAASKEGRGHSSHVTTVEFLDNERLISVGGRDMSIFQWKIV